MRHPPEMTSSIRSSITASARKCLCTVLTGAMLSTSFPAWAATQVSGQASGERAAEDEEPAADESTEAAAEVGGNVALLRFDGDQGVAEELREYVHAALSGEGYVVKGIKRSFAEAAKKNRCDGAEDSCLAKVAKYLNKNSRTPFDFYVFADVPTPDTGASQVIIYDIAKEARVINWAPTFTSNDYVIGAALPAAMAFELRQHQDPRPPLSAEEREALDNPGDPEKTQEEIAEEKRILDQAQQVIADAKRAQALQNVEIDLKKEFKSFCRKGPREDRETTNIEGETVVIRDLRPPCDRGPFFGYWQPRSWVTMVLTLGAGIGAGTVYGITLAKRGTWKEKRDALDAAIEADNVNKNEINWDTLGAGTSSCDNSGDTPCFGDLAGQVSDAGHEVKKMAIIGDVMLLSTVVLAGVFTVMLAQDRSAAKKYLIQEKSMSLANLRVSPILGRDLRGRSRFGAAASFNF